MPKPTVAALVAVLGVTLPAVARAHEEPLEWHWWTSGTCTTCGGAPRFHWDPYHEEGSPFGPIIARNGALDTGTGLDVRSCLAIAMNGIPVNASTYTAAHDDRGVVTEEIVTGSFVRVTRDLYFPEDGLDFGRWVDAFHNVGGGIQRPTIEYSCAYQGCAGGDCVASTSDGDRIVEASDTWLVLDDESDSGHAAVAIVTHGPGATGPSDLTLDADGNLVVTFTPEIAPDQTRNVVVFLVQASDPLEAAAVAESLAGLLPDATADLPEDFVYDNFVVDDLPDVFPGGPYRVAEGGEALLDAAVRDDDPLIVSWDLDGDGDFDDADDLGPLVSAAGLDGPSEITVALRAVEDVAGGREVVGEATIQVANVAPVIVSVPPASARADGEYVYAPEVRDPAGDADAPTFALVDGEHPDGMEVSADGVVSWTPGVEALGDHAVALVVADGDGGEVVQRWSVAVGVNASPGAPDPAFPLDASCAPLDRPGLRIYDAVDPDGDALRYHFEIATDAGFSPLVASTPEDGIVPDGSGLTTWTPPRALEPGTYFWRAWATDGIAAGEPSLSFFEICTDEEVPPTTVAPISEAPGCACNATPTPPALSLFLLLLWGKRRARALRRDDVR